MAERNPNALPVPTDRIALIDQKRLFAGLAKTKAFDSELKTWGRALEKELQELITDDSISSEEKKLRADELRLKGMEDMPRKKKEMRDELLADIAKAIAELAAKHGYMLVLDEGMPVEGVKNVLYAASDADSIEGTIRRDQSLRTTYLEAGKPNDPTEDVLSVMNSDVQ